MIQLDLDPKVSFARAETTNEVDLFTSINDGDLSYSDFFNKFLILNRPCVIKQVSTLWQCQRDWVANGSPNFDYLASQFGDEEVPVADCSKKYYNSHPKSTMRFSEYINYWRHYDNGQGVRQTSFYLKDWHCFRINPTKKLYKVPEYFASDWLNEYYQSFSELNDDYRFVYMGPKGTWTPLHKDVFSSFSWSVNICGCKKWVFYPPHQEPYLTDKFGNLAFDVKDCANFPQIPQAESHLLVQGQGDAVFVPSGWYHQVWNEGNTISINHNWVNGCNIEHMLLNLLEELKQVEKELSDCKESPEWVVDCQRLLKATFGLDLNQFIEFLLFIAGRRITSFKNNCHLSVHSGYSIGLNHIKFDLLSLKRVFNQILNLTYRCFDWHKVNELLKEIEILDLG